MSALLHEQPMNRRSWDLLFFNKKISFKASMHAFRYKCTSRIFGLQTGYQLLPYCSREPIRTLATVIWNRFMTTYNVSWYLGRSWEIERKAEGGDSGLKFAAYVHSFISFTFSSRASMSNTEVSQAVLNGKKFLQNRRPLLLGISPGNPHYYQMEALERLFDFARRNSDKVGKRHQPPLTFTANA